MKKSANEKSKSEKSKSEKSKRDLNIDLDILETDIKELKILYEQYFSGIIPKEPTAMRDDVVRQIKTHRQAPFHNSQTRFRLKMLESRFQSFKTYWERVNRDREQGKYSRDIFKSELKVKQSQPVEKNKELITESTLMRLFGAYQTALKKTGADSSKAEFSTFKKSLLERAKTYSEKHPGEKLNYKVGIKNGKVVVVAKN